MLPVRHRLTRRADFALTTRVGARVGAGHVVLHLAARPDDGPTRVGFVVSRKVGGSVVRHAVTRRLRAVAVEALRTIPTGFDLVIRALPAAASGDFATLRDEVLRVLPVASAKAART